MPSRYFRVPLHEIGYVRMIVEAYDGLAFVRSLSASRGEIEWLVGEGMEEEADAVAAKLGQEVGLLPIDRPADWVDLEDDRRASSRVEPVENRRQSAR